MLFVVFRLGDDRYAVEATQVIEVLPLVNWKRLPGAPPGIAGIMDYRGTPAPLLDLAELALGQPSRKWLSTRIVVINCRPDSNPPRLAGFLAERATETMQRNQEDFLPSGITVTGAPWLGPIAATPEGPIQQIDVQHLVGEQIRNLLFAEAPQTGTRAIEPDSQNGF